MIQEVSDAIEKVSSGCIDDGSGRVCEFYKVSDNTGAKVYKDEKCGTDNMNSQRYLYNLGLAPEVRSDLIKFNNGRRDRWMFLTEIAKTVMEICDEEDIPICECGSVNSCDCYLGHDFYTHSRFPEMGVLFDKLSELGFNDEDAHWGNYGYLEDGTAVAIDCEFPHLYN